MNVSHDPTVNALLSTCIFKYAKLEYLQNSLDNCTMHLSRLSDYNDIYENEYRFVHYFHSEEDQKKATGGAFDPFSAARGVIERYLESLKLTCFSRSATNNLMWAHYAKNHTGICYCFEMKYQPPFKPDDTLWGNVMYSSHVPELNIYQDQTTEGMLRADAVNIVLTKSADWAYEQEVRFHRPQDENTIEFEPSRLKAIIVGRRVADERIAELEKWIDEFNHRHHADLSLLFAHRLPSKFALGIHSDKGLRDGAEESFSARVPVLSDIKSRRISSLPPDLK